MAIDATIIDYGMGNLWSVISALNYLGYQPAISSDPDQIRFADRLILPGVGSFFQAMETLRETQLDQAIKEAVKCSGRNILGICLGMQLLGESGTEDGTTKGLGLIKGRTDKFLSEEVGDLKVPHIGFNLVYANNTMRLFKGLNSGTDFYFVHSYRMLPQGLSGETAICRYGIEFLAAYENGNVFATQFHPEKSQSNGLLLLKNFMEI